MKRKRLYELFFLNLGVLCISTSGVLGRYIKLGPEAAIFWRTAVASICLVALCKWFRIRLFKESKKDSLIFISAGVLMLLHWVFYFYSLKLSNVAIGMLSLFTFPIMTSILEPLLLGTRFIKAHILVGLATIFGLSLLVPSDGFQSSYGLAIALGLLSALSYTLRNILMKSRINTHDGTKLMTYQCLTAAFFLSPTIVTTPISVVLDQWWVIAALALITTVIGHTLFLKSFKHFSITTASMISYLQPLYGILLGVIFLSEYPRSNTYIGGAIILLAVLYETVSSSSQTADDISNNADAL